MDAYTCNAFQVRCSLSHFLLLHFLHSDSSRSRFTPLHSCCLVLLKRLLTAIDSHGFYHTPTHSHCTDKSTCFIPSTRVRCTTLPLYFVAFIQYCTVYALPMFVLACVACCGCVFVMFLTTTQKAIHTIKTHAKHLRITLLATAIAWLFLANIVQFAYSVANINEVQ
jgi:hypothetical protein